jgi:hypothetical protein
MNIRDVQPQVQTCLQHAPDDTRGRVLCRGMAPCASQKHATPIIVCNHITQMRGLQYELVLTETTPRSLLASAEHTRIGSDRH